MLNIAKKHISGKYPLKTHFSYTKSYPHVDNFYGSTRGKSVFFASIFRRYESMLHPAQIFNSM